MDDRKKEPKKLTELLEDLIAAMSKTIEAQNKTIEVLEQNARLSQEQIEYLKEKSVRCNIYQNGHQEEIIEIQTN